MENRNSKSSGCLLLIVLSVVVVIFLLDEDPPVQPESPTGLPNMEKTVFADVYGEINDERVKVKVVLNNDKTGSLTQVNYNNNSASHFTWSILLENKEMLKIQPVFGGSSKGLLILYSNKEATLAADFRQFIGKWYQ